MENSQTKREKREQFIREMKQREEENRKTGKKHRRLITVILIVVFCLIAGTVSGVFTYRYLKNSGYFLHKYVSMYTDHFTVDNAMMTYFVQNAYLSDLDTYGDEFEQYNLNPDKKLKDQTYQDSTWLNYYMDAAKDKIEMILTLAEAATVAGVTLDDYEKKQVENTLSAVDYSRLVSGIREEDVRKCCEMLTLAAKYQKILADSFTYTEEQYLNYYNEHLSDIAVYDAVSCSISADTVGGDEAASIYASALSECKEETAFFAQLRFFYQETGGEMTEDELQKKLNECSKTGAVYTYDEIGSWAFGDTVKVGDNHLYHDAANNRYVVTRMMKLPYADESKTVNVRHILFTAAAYGSESAAEAMAQQVQNAYRQDSCEENFALLAHQYSEDAGSQSSGGLYENVYNGQMSEAFNDWCFDAKRQTGDVGIVHSSHGFHLMYYVSDGLSRWQAQVDAARRESDFNVLYSTLAEQYTVTYVIRGLDKIDL